ncbi:MAG TPA: CHASE2 domain-containing protein, partial [Pirellulales bacterium]|nr:CHASE2 domain-containing protein [Pirellulales bacterium]
MLSKIRRNRPGVLGGALVYLVLVAFELLAPREWLGIIREHGYDEVLFGDLQLRASPREKPAVIVVDIDRRTLARLGSWPWPRATMARLVGAVAAGKPKALGMDILFAGPDPRSSAAADRGMLDVASQTLLNGDQALAQAIRSVPTALASTLETAPGPTAATATVLRRGSILLDDIWHQPGANEPFPTLAAAAKGNGITSLPGDPDGKVRRVPLLVGVGTRLRPGLAVETVRVAQGASTLIVEADPQRLVVGEHSIALSFDGFLRLVPVRPVQEPARTISAIDVIEDDAKRARLGGAIVLIGGSAPEL